MKNYQLFTPSCGDRHPEVFALACGKAKDCPMMKGD